MTYKINGTEIAQPTTGRWMEREPLGINGFGQSIYAGVREFEMKWVINTPAEFNAIQNFFLAVGNTGTVVVDLPQYGAATYTFFSYTGCILNEPMASPYFTQHHTEVTLLVRNIRT